MKAIIIEEDRFVEIAELMKAKALEIKTSRTRSMIDAPQAVWDAVVSEVSRSIHYHFVQWAQSHGASCIRR